MDGRLCEASFSQQWGGSARRPSQPRAGFFERDRFHGDGTYFDSRGDAYSGAWSRGVKHGAGTFLCRADASELSGTWFKGALIVGKWLWADGTVWLGTFRDSQPLGQGTFYFPNGTMQEGEYVAAGQAAPDGEAAAGKSARG